MSKDSLSPYLWMLLGSFSFAIMGVTAHSLGETCDWQLIALARCGLAFLFSLFLVWMHGARLAIWKPGILWIRSLSGSVSMVCTFYCLAHLPVADVLTLTNMFPIWVTLLSWPLEGEAPPRSLWLAVLSGVAGVALIQQPHIAEGNWATLLALISSFFSAVAMLGLHNIKGVDVRAIVVHFSGVATVFAIAALFLFDHSSPVENHWAPWTLLLLLAVGLSATIGQLFLTRAFSAGDPSRVSVVGLTQIVFAMLLDALLLGNHFDLMRMLGITLVIAPTAWVMLKGRTPPEKEEMPEQPRDDFSFGGNEEPRSGAAERGLQHAPLSRYAAPRRG